jgi:hypothetical protein
MLPEERYHFRGVGAFIWLGVGAALLPFGLGLAALGRALRKGDALSWLAAAGLSGAGLAQAALVLSCRNADVRLTDDGVVVRLGRLWNQTIPYRVIAAAVPVRRSPIEGFGVRTDGRGTVAVAPWGIGAVELDLSPPLELPIVPGYRHSARRLLLGVHNEQSFATAVMNRVLFVTRSGQ